MFLKTVLENSFRKHREHLLLCYLNLVFIVFSMFFKKKKNCESNMFSLFLRTENSIEKYDEPNRP